jgi:hypothetical protein
MSEIKGIKQIENGKTGEARTRAMLIRDFWVLERSVDIAGADFLLQLQADSLEEIWDRQKRIEVLGIIQAKYFEGKNQIQIKKCYVEDSQGPRTEFFALLHTDDENETAVHYFFTSEQIITQFYSSKCDEYYCFSLTESRDYKNYKNLSKQKIVDIIKEGILNTEEERNRELVKIVYVETKCSVYKTKNQTIIENGFGKHILSQKEGHYTITKINKASGVESVVMTGIGNLDDYEYNPTSETITAKSKSLTDSY